jgi:hypothetical protein
VSRDRNGEGVALEVTELVSEKVVKMNMEGKEVYFDWDRATVVHAIERILKKKGSRLRKVNRAQYSKFVLVIHTDEDTLPYSEYHQLLRNQVFQRVPGIDQAYVLFSYDPSLKGYGHVPLSFENSNSSSGVFG